ncbi:nucleotide-binding protein [Paenibacillus sp. YPG26]|uniref:TIR domain-containing protein n=1 Tax=Paenibacillus sp. YPG26 TaxID=2878915 RepID=UPI00203B3DD4|nr:nucleotide-binding protein [Paenibacillus sp. YPG26]USB33973.1 nucleotide-binding protein [Paenibacillus sp. YPG26]
MSRPSVFIGSSKEAIPIVNAVQEELEHYALVTPWHRGVFQPGRYTMEDLEAQLHESDFAVFIFHPDDVTTIRGKLYYTARDNTIFEMGLFWSRLGRERVFFLLPANIPVQEADEDKQIDGFRTPSDLLGMTTLTYQFNPKNWNSSVGVACGKMGARFTELGPKNTDPAELLQQSVEERERLLRIIGFFEELNHKATMETELYNRICRALRLSFIAAPYTVSGSALFKAEDRVIRQVGSDGIGELGREYSLEVNQDKKAAHEIIHVVDVHLSGNVSFSQRNRKSIVKEYILCYPLAKRYVFTIHLKGTVQVDEALFETICYVNKTLLDSIHDLLGGEAP